MGANDILQHKHAFTGVIEVRYSNPNGEREGSGAPRCDVTTGIGQITDVCLKRKVREAWRIINDALLYIDNDQALNNKVLEAAKESGTLGPLLAAYQAQKKTAEDDKKDKDPLDILADAVKKDATLFDQVFQSLLETYPDIRAFGGVFAKMNQHIDGPVQFTMAESVLPIEIKTISMTRKAIANDEKFYGDGANTMFGEKQVVTHALYVFKGEMSAVKAAKTHFTEEDKEKFFTALKYMFSFDKSAVRSDISLRCLYDFECNSRLGLDAPTFQLWEALEVAPVQDVLDGIRPAQAYEDYTVTLHADRVPAGVTIHQIV